MFNQYEFTLKPSHFICTYPVTQAPTRSLRDAAPEAGPWGLRMHRTTEEKRIIHHESHNKILHFPHILRIHFVSKSHTSNYPLTIEKETPQGPNQGQPDRHHNTDPKRKITQPTLENNHRKIIM